MVLAITSTYNRHFDEYNKKYKLHKCCFKKLTNTAISIAYRRTDGLEVSCFVLLFLKVY